MSFVFPSWSTAFSASFYDDAKAMLETALNKGNKPPVIQGRIEVVDLNMGSQPPTLTLLEIGDLSLDRFRGILRLGYQGDAWITVRCLVQANPLSHNPNLIPSSTLPISTPLLASQPLLVPMTLRLSRLHLRAILILVVSKAKGITLVFKNDPLQNVDVSSTFDSVEVIRGYLQQEIEGQLREMFREDLPGIIHRLSQKWFTGSGGSVETPYRDAEPAPTAQYEDGEDYDPTSLEGRDVFGPPQPVNITPKRRALHVTGSAPNSAQRERPPSVALSESPTSYTVFPDIENYDPTYGLRPEGLPTHSGYEAFGRLWERARGGGGRGLGSLMGGSGPLDDQTVHEDEVESGDEPESEEEPSFEMEYGHEEEYSDSRRPSLSRQSSHTSTIHWETFPAVGGGVVSRPRVFHTQSQIRAPSESGVGGAMPSPSGTAGTATGGSVTARASSIGGTSTIGSVRGRGGPHSSMGLLSYHPAIAHAPPLRRTLTSHSDRRAESLATFAMQHSHAIAHRSGSPRPSNLRHSRGASRSSASRELPISPPLAPPRAPRPLSMDAGARLRSATDPMRDQPRVTTRRERATSFTTSIGAPVQPFPRPGITLPMNNSVSQLATLSLSANTLSPYARAHEHIAVRSFPHLGRVGAQPSVAEALPSVESMKGRRKRIFKLGGLPSRSPTPLGSPESERTPPLDWDDETRLASSSSESASRWRVPSISRPASVAPGSAMGFPFPKIPE